MLWVLVVGFVASFATAQDEEIAPPLRAPVLAAFPAATTAATVTLQGTVENGAREIEVSAPARVFRVPAGAGRFTAVVPLAPNKKNAIVLTAIDTRSVRGASATALVTHDTTPPDLFVDGPASGSTVTTTSVDVFGRVGDLLSGFQGLKVTVNDVPAAVDPGIGTNGTFFAGSVPLLVSDPPEPTELRVFAQDALGNRVGKSVFVTHVPVPPGTPKIEIVSGNAQQAQVLTHVAQPLVVKLTDGQGAPFVGKVVTYIVDNNGLPIGGVPLDLFVNGRAVAQTRSDVDGQFAFTAIPDSGPAQLDIHGLLATTLGGQPIAPGTFPEMAFHPLLLPNANNQLADAVRLPRLDPANWVEFDNTRDVELRCAGIEGLRFLVRAGSMTLSGGARPAPGRSTLIGVHQVHFDEIPMPMPNGAAPPFAWTFQPSSARFDPPVEVVLPNMSGLPGGAATFVLSFDHETNQFEIVATGSVTPDGAFVVSDPGAGITNSGWGGFCPPYPNTGTVDKDYLDEEMPILCDDYAQKKGTGAGALAHQIQCIAERSSGYDCATGRRGPKPPWAGDYVEKVFEHFTPTIADESLIRPNLPIRFAQRVCRLLPGWLPTARVGPFTFDVQDACFIAEGFGVHYTYHLTPAFTKVIPEMVKNGKAAGRSRDDVLADIRRQHEDFFNNAVVPCFGVVAGAGELHPLVALGGALGVPVVAGHLRESIIASLPALCPGGDDGGDLITLPAPLTRNQLFSGDIASLSRLDVTAPGNAFFLRVGNQVQLTVIDPATSRDLTAASTGTVYFACDGDTVFPISADGLLTIDQASNCLPNQRPKLHVFVRNGDLVGIGQFATEDVDTDVDLIVDSFERMVGLNPAVANGTSSDLDGDGLTDFQECMFLTKPLVRDTDGDGVDDRLESARGTDPLNPRSKEPRMNGLFLVTVNGQRTRAAGDGSFRVTNVSTLNNPIRVVAKSAIAGGAGSEGRGDKFYAVSEFFDLQNQQTYTPQQITLFADPPPTPVRLRVEVPTPVLTSNGATTQLRVEGDLSDGSIGDLTARATGSRYQASNSQVITVGPDGLVTAVGDGLAFVTASNEGVSARSRGVKAPTGVRSWCSRVAARRWVGAVRWWCRMPACRAAARGRGCGRRAGH